MSIGTVLTLGLGDFTGGGVKFLPTLGYGTSGTPPVPPAPVLPTDQASNWQADYWKHSSRTKKKRREDDEDERIRLGILPPAEREQADAAVAVAVNANVALRAERISDGEAVLAKMDAREQYEQAYRDAYREAYIASVVAEHWKEDLRIATRRRKAVLLLLH